MRLFAVLLAVLALAIPAAASGHSVPISDTGWGCGQSGAVIPYAPNYSLVCINPYGGGYHWWLVHWH